MTHTYYSGIKDWIISQFFRRPNPKTTKGFIHQTMETKDCPLFGLETSAMGVWLFLHTCCAQKALLNSECAPCMYDYAGNENCSAIFTPQISNMQPQTLPCPTKHNNFTEFWVSCYISWTKKTNSRHSRRKSSNIQLWQTQPSGDSNAGCCAPSLGAG